MSVAGFASVALRAVADVFLPRFCICCGLRLSAENAIDICPSCEASTRLPGGRYCARCSAPMAPYAEKCPNCHNMHMIVRETAAHGFYQGILRENLLALKFHGRRHLVRTLGALAGRAAMKKWPGMKFDTVVAVPLHRKRRLERGFDQACDLAYYTACEMGLKHRPRILRRTRNTPSQVGLTRSARVKNVHDAFRAGNVAGLERVLLVDDTMTTGATIASAARALRDGGVGSIFAAVVARTGPLETADGDVGGVQ